MIELASDLFGVTVSTGTVDAICQRASDALAGPHAQLHDWVLDQRAVRVDETGWRTAGDGRALWTLTTRTRRSFGSPSTATASSSRRSSAPTPGSSSPIAGTAMSTATRTGAKCAGHTSSATSPPLRRTRRAEDLRRDRPRTHASGVQGMARLPARAPRSQTAQPADSAPSNRTTRTTARRLAREPAAATCRLQRRSLSAYLRDLLIAHNRGDPFPSAGPWTERLLQGPDYQGFLYGHGWARTSDLSRVKRYRIRARSPLPPCKHVENHVAGAMPISADSGPIPQGLAP
jgi:Transposase IS66 family